MTRASKANQYNKFFLENKLNLFETWQGIREVINISKKGNKVINCIQNVNNMTLNSPKAIAEEFNKHFTSIARNIEKKLIQPNCDFSKFLKNPNRDSFFITPTTKEEVTSSIKTLKNSKSTGPSSIPTKFLKLFQNTLNEPIAFLANLSFSTGIFPTNLKVANVIPLFKKDDHTFCSNYRPISLLSNLSKITERLIHTRLTMFLNINSILCEKQFGFSHCHSTTHALIEIIEKIKQACNSEQYACGVFLDLRKAFVTVNHDILLRKLDYCGIRGVTNSWFRSYLQDRMQFTSVNGYQSNIRQLKCGVPQGSVLPTTFYFVH